MLKPKKLANWVLKNKQFRILYLKWFIFCALFYGNRYFVIMYVLCQSQLFTICQTTNISESFHQSRHRYMMGDAPFLKTEANVAEQR